jgi:hypothetical protein
MVLKQQPHWNDIQYPKYLCRLFIIIIIAAAAAVACFCFAGYEFMYELFSPFKFESVNPRQNVLNNVKYYSHLD